MIVEDVTTSPIFAGSTSLPVLLAAGVRALQSTPLLDRAGRFLGLISTHYRAPRQFAETELDWLDLLAHHAADVIERQRADELLARSHEELEQRVTERTKWLTLMHDVTRAINDAPTWDEGLHQVLRRICETEHWQIGFVYLPDRDEPDSLTATVSYFGDERFRPFHRLSERRRYGRGESLPGRVFADGVVRWVNTKEALLEALPVRAKMAMQVGLKSSVALPIRSGQEVIAVLELFSDREHPPSDMLVNLMNDVSLQIGKVLDRERTTAHMADLLWREQQALLHTLHDTLGQTLTGIGMLSSALTQRLSAADPGSVETAKEIAHQAQQALDQVRQLDEEPLSGRGRGPESPGGAARPRDDDGVAAQDSSPRRGERPGDPSRRRYGDAALSHRPGGDHQRRQTRAGSHHHNRDGWRTWSHHFAHNGRWQRDQGCWFHQRHGAANHALPCQLSWWRALGGARREGRDRRHLRDSCRSASAQTRRRLTVRLWQ